MPILWKNQWPVEHVPEPSDFESPFPSAGGDPLTAKLNQMIGAEENAAKQANAYRNALAIGMKNAWTSPTAGGIRHGWLDRVAWDEQKGEHTALLGIFSVVDFTATVNPDQMLQQAVKSGLKVAQNWISAVPVVGPILSAAIGVGLWFWELASKPSEEAQRIVPWQEFRQDADEEFTRTAIGEVAASVDWTKLYAPSMAVNRGFSVNETEKGGATRTYGAYINSDPDYTGGLGFMPGSQRITDVIQIAELASWGTGERRDAVTNLGDYTPSVSQFCTAIWQFVQKRSSGDMYKVQAARLIEQWTRFFETFYEAGFDIIAQARSKHTEAADISALFTAKALASMMYVESRPTAGSPWYPHEPAIGVWDDILSKLSWGFPAIFTKENLQALMSEDGWIGPLGQPNTRWRPVHKAVILPALRSLKQRQMALLSQSVACAYVRYESVEGLPPFAAFTDKTDGYGDELAEHCHDMRELFLDSQDRFLVENEDARNVDPVYGDRLAESKLLEPGEFPVAGIDPKRSIEVLPLFPGAESPDEAGPPAGGAPFQAMLAKGRRRPGGAGFALAAAAAALLLLKGRK